MKEPGTENATIVLADGALFVLTENGDFLVAPASKSEFKPTTRVKLFEGLCWTVPTICNGRLYARNEDTIKCIELK